MTTTPTAPAANHDRTISPAALRDRRDPLVVDVRGAAEFETRHIRGSRHVPLAVVADHADDLVALWGGADSRPILVCQSGVRAEQARQHLAAAGLAGAQVLDGGVPAYVDAGGDVVTGRAAWALERQVRLVAGSLVLTGILGGRLLHPGLRMLAGGIGAGLTFSALSDTCAMGAALARLPHNRAAADPTAQQVLRQQRDTAADTRG